MGKQNGQRALTNAERQAKWRLAHVSTPEEKCIGFPEQNYIGEAGNKGS
jgi:hypothetical protein